MSIQDNRLFVEPNEEEPDDQIDVWLDGEVIQSFTYDDIGFSGIQAIISLVEKIQQAM